MTTSSKNASKSETPRTTVHTSRAFKTNAQREPYQFAESQRLWTEAQQVIAGGTQGTRQPLYPDYPAYFARAKGCRMWDVDGNEFIDLLCSIGPILLGYAYDRVDDAARAIMADSFQSSSNHAVQIELARLICEMIPSAQRVRFLKTGTEATVAATRLARHITGRINVARCGYHGWADLWRNGEQGGTDPDAWKSVLPFDGTAESLETLLKQTAEPFAAVILCPADTKPFTTANFQGIIDVAHAHGALVIFDEVKTGFRVARGGAQEYLDVLPDITTISKGMGNGYPIAALAGKAEYMERIAETPTSGTFSVEALSIAASLATLREVQEKPVIEHLDRMGRRLISGLQEICAAYRVPNVAAYADPIPAMIRFTWNPAGGNECEEPMHHYFFSECYRYGLFFCPWHVAFVNYSHQKKDIDEALDICDFVMARTKKHGADSKTRPNY